MPHYILATPSPCPGSLTETMRRWRLWCFAKNMLVLSWDYKVPDSCTHRLQWEFCQHKHYCLCRRGQMLVLDTHWRQQDLCTQVWRQSLALAVLYMWTGLDSALTAPLWIQSKKALSYNRASHAILNPISTEDAGSNSDLWLEWLSPTAPVGLSILALVFKCSRHSAGCFTCYIYRKLNKISVKEMKTN